MLEEEHVFILEGRLALRFGDESHAMKAGDPVCCPAGQQIGHRLLNHTDKACRYLLVGEGYVRAARMEYWEKAP
jgi:uncharacterized cupin superfamily protein